MTSFTSLLSSIGGAKQNEAPKPKPNTSESRRTNGNPDLTKPVVPQTNGAARPTIATAGVKRKPEEQADRAQAKVFKTEVKVPVRPPAQNAIPSRPATSALSPGPYRGTARPLATSGSATSAASASVTLARPAASVTPVRPTAATPVRPTAAAPRPAAAPPRPANPAAATTSSGDGGAKPKRGFASIMEKAKAAQQAAKAAGTTTIKHKPVEKTTKKERLKAQQEEAKQKVIGKSGKPAAKERSRSGTPSDQKAGSLKKAPELSYKGTIKKAVAQPQISYKGTMRKAEPSSATTKAVSKKGMGQDRYGGYASWSDLDEAASEEEDYESEGSDDMDAGFDDMAREEEMALKVARKEDQEALEEEERLKREKLERKKKLQALSKNAAARKKF